MTVDTRSKLSLGGHPSDEVVHESAAQIFLLAPQGAAFQGLYHEVQRNFPAFQVVLAEQCPRHVVNGELVRLVLIDHSRVPVGFDELSECRRSFPNAAIGLMVEPNARFDPNMERLIAERLVNGILPLNLPLDVWLAVTSLLLSGGEYFPADTARVVTPRFSVHSVSNETDGYLSGQPNRASAPRTVLDRLAESFPARAGPTPDENDEGDDAQRSVVETLTTRERQILHLVSEGCQNKLIAHRMSLSEHTVKAHVHNLIAKLRVSNRTQAAALYHGSADQAAGYDAVAKYRG
ncbi:response regulator transcription factor [Devosia rhodophyticola]|uniref:Response regulator transcription factor n=1 Tax=Devosia rhodophyticola TaxID=3026423 RepID=A0ABY7YZB9_9HYPH|nr:response regulator transcription factor [Devosia rhodophyticola]WDR06120.1 response regulator transcription factor [Devosia rhodophyticola]